MMQHIVYDTCVYDYLYNHYNNILLSMLKEEFYIIQDKVYDVFYEITYFNEVIGFVCGNYHKDNVFIVELCYILPKFRDMGFFTRSIDFIGGVLNKELYLFLPNHYAINSLVENNYAIRFGDFVLSDFVLCFVVDEELVCSRVYDYRNCCIVNPVKECVSHLLDVDVLSRNVDRNIDENYWSRVNDSLMEYVFLI